MRQNYSFSKNSNALLEPCEGKLSCTVLRGEGPSNGANLLDNSGGIRTEHHAIYDNACRSRSTGFCQRTVFVICQSRYYSRCSRLRIVYHLLQYALFRHRIFGIPCFKHCICRIKNTCYTIRKANQNGNGCIRNKKWF